MSGKPLYDGSVKTQSIEAVKALLAWKGRAVDPLPSDVTLDNGRMVLVLSNKRDAYYTVTVKACSCPSAVYHPDKSCKHQRKYFHEQIAKPAATEPDSIRPDVGHFRPFSLLPSEERAAKAIPSMLIDLHDTLPGEVAYWERKDAMEMLKSEA